MTEADKKSLYDKLRVDIVSVHLGSDFLSSKDGHISLLIELLRNNLVDKYGYIVSNIVVKSSEFLNNNEYSILIRENEVARGVIYSDRRMIDKDEWDEKKYPLPEDVIYSTRPIYNSDIYWVKTNDIPKNVNSSKPDKLFQEHLEHILIKYVDDIFSISDTIKYIEKVREKEPILVEYLIPKLISELELRKIFVNFIREMVSIKDQLFIFEKLCNFAKYSKEPDILSERLRVALGRKICLTHTDENRVLFAVTLSQEWEKTLDESCEKTELGKMFNINPKQVQRIIENSAWTLHGIQEKIGNAPVILCSPRIRLPLYQLLERHIPYLVVISYAELISDIEVKELGRVEMKSPVDKENVFSINGKRKDPEENKET